MFSSTRSCVLLLICSPRASFPFFFLVCHNLTLVFVSTCWVWCKQAWMGAISGSSSLGSHADGHGPHRAGASTHTPGGVNDGWEGHRGGTSAAVDADADAGGSSKSAQGNWHQFSSAFGLGGAAMAALAAKAGVESSPTTAAAAAAAPSTRHDHTSSHHGTVWMEKATCRVRVVHTRHLTAFPLGVCVCVCVCVVMGTCSVLPCCVVLCCVAATLSFVSRSRIWNEQPWWRPLCRVQDPRRWGGSDATPHTR